MDSNFLDYPVHSALQIAANASVELKNNPQHLHVQSLIVHINLVFLYAVIK